MSPVQPVLRVVTTRAGMQLTMTLTGELDLATAPHLLDQLRALDGTARRPTSVLIDAASLTFVDVAGVRALCTLAESLAAAGVGLRLHRSTPQLDRLLRLLGIGPTFVSRGS